MMPAPHTYSEWTKVLDIFKAKEDDAGILPVMKEGTLEWQSGVAERFSKRLVDAVNTRMNAASDKFQRDMNYARGAEGAIVQTMWATWITAGRASGTTWICWRPGRPA